MTFARARKLARYNRPLYATIALVITAGVLAAAASPLPTAVRVIAAAFALGGAWFGAASFLAFHWMFDRSELLRWEWLVEELGAPRRWVEVSVALEETTPPMPDLFPGSEGRMLDIYDEASTPAPAIAAARRRGAATSATAVPLEALPVADGWADAAVVVLAAHEIRDRAARGRFFAELARVLREGGQLVLVEHLRNLAAAAAFGPGMFHFLPRREWMRLAHASGLRLTRERAITPFVRVLVYGRAEGPPTGTATPSSTR
jgi:SAM-dependent methyltransferase